MKSIFLILPLALSMKLSASGLSLILLDCTHKATGERIVTCEVTTSPSGGPSRKKYTLKDSDGVILCESRSEIIPNGEVFNCEKPIETKQCKI